MILKSMSRKGSARVHFPQLYDYISRDAQPEHQLWHNFMHHEPDRATTLRSFVENGSLIRQDSRHNILYHEIISLTRYPGSKVSHQIAALRELARSYLDQRASKQMAYGAIHLDKDHSVHLHLMISSNDIGSKRRVRLPKAEFLQIQRDMEKILHRDFPELQQQKIYNREKFECSRTSDKEQNLKRRTKAASKKDQLRETLEKVFSHAPSREEAEQALKSFGIDLKTRGKTVTAVQGKLRCRLKTLDLENVYQQIGKERETEPKSKVTQVERESGLRTLYRNRKSSDFGRER